MTDTLSAPPQTSPPRATAPPTPSAGITRPPGTGPVIRRTGGWPPEEQQRLVDLVRHGVDLPDLVEALNRSRAPIVTRLRLMLPLAHRDCPADLVLTAAREAFADPDHDWRAAQLLSPPPRPIEQVVLSGVAGLTDDQLVTVAYSLLTSHGYEERLLLAELLPLLRERQLSWRVTERRRNHLLHHNLSVEEAERAAHAWYDDETPRRTRDGWYPGYW